MIMSTPMKKSPLIWNRHGHECLRIWKLSGNFTLIQCIKKCREFLGRDILGTTFFRAESSLIQSSCRSLRNQSPIQSCRSLLALYLCKRLKSSPKTRHHVTNDHVTIFDVDIQKLAFDSPSTRCSCHNL